MGTTHLQSNGHVRTSLSGREPLWLRSVFAAILALLLLSSASARAELIPSGRQRLVASDAAPGKAFGDAVAVEGDTAVVGAPFDSTQAANAGAAYVFIRVNGAWLPHPSTPKLLGSVSAAGDQFGSAVAISGQSIVVGAVARNFAAGAAYAFRRASSASTGAWTQEQQLTPSAALSPQDQFGCALGASGNTVVVGAQGDTGNQGAAYVFVRGTGSPLWTQQTRLLPTTRVPSATFGESVALSTDTAVIGASGQTDEGAAFVFRRVGLNWGSGQALTTTGTSIPAPLNGDSFGRSVAVSGNWVLVGAPGADGALDDVGSAYFFERSGAFVARQRFESPTPTQFGEFGRAVVMAGTRALVSAPQELSEQGQAHLFSLAPTGTWVRAQSRLSSGQDEVAGFGRAIAVSADSALIGASQEPCTNECSAQGSAYAYGVLELVSAVPLLPPSVVGLLAGALALCGVGFLRWRVRPRAIL